MENRIDVKKVDVTPDLAEKWLLKNTHNRKLYETVVDSYALDMKRGNWILNHQGICFDEDGVLLDGQHRLEAIKRSGKTVTMFVFRNMPKGYVGNGNHIVTQDTIDDIKKRCIGDKLHLSYGMENANLKVAMCNIITSIILGRAPKLSAAIVKNIYDLFADQIETVVDCKTANVGHLCLAPVLGAFAIAVGPFNEQTVEFMKGYFEGDNLAKMSPILVFRNYMLNRTSLPYSGTAKEYARITIVNHALNCIMHHIMKRQLKQLKKTNQGTDFFLNHQKKTCDELIQLVRL